MNNIFFNRTIGTPKLGFVNTDQTVEELIAEGVIPTGASTLTKAAPTDSDTENLAMLTHVDKITFDDMDNPTALVWDMSLVDLWWKDVYRSCRTELLTTLDSLQTRALAKGLTSVVADMEVDKETLRNMPSSVDYSTATTFTETLATGPNELFVDYNEKYRTALA
jgi:hypothetical protein